ncbi:MAG: hypothetical protein R2825_25195 [Saprospiraceae bacterium]
MKRPKMVIFTEAKIGGEVLVGCAVSHFGADRLLFPLISPGEPAPEV